MKKSPTILSCSEVEAAQLAPKPPGFLRKQKLSGRRRQGIKYEHKVQQHLVASYPDWYLPSPWLMYRLRGNSKWLYCQPDGLLFLPEEGKIVIVEVKYQHTPAAYEQVELKYLPILRRLFPEARGWSHASCEIVHWYDPYMQFPVEPVLQPEVGNSQPGVFSVHIWNPNYHSKGKNRT